MFLKLFNSLRYYGVPVSLREYLVLLEGIDKGLCKENSIDDFYSFAKLCLVKDEKYFDKFDKAFEDFYKFQNSIINLSANFPENWLIDELKKQFTDEMKNEVKNNKDWQEILDAFKKKVEEQKKSIRVEING